MIAVIQRVSSATVKVDGELVGSCGQGLCVLLGVAKGDTQADADALSRKILNLRIFEDDAGKMNRSVLDVGGGMLIVSNFTLLAAYKKGNRPDYMGAAAPDEANELYEYFAGLCAEHVPVGRGVFGADMKVDIANDGPVTIVMDSAVLLGKQG
ncbi:MAG: D-tyrosyl-tRNA(Tyr) deacylase [Ruminococcaceae bacterium]|nr:D-tyrosyl-tRNA(Tyr) deacylase [Oscillospiraceae bacterium]